MLNHRRVWTLGGESVLVRICEMFPGEENILQCVPRQACLQGLGKTASQFSPLQPTFTDWNYSCALIWSLLPPPPSPGYQPFIHSFQAGMNGRGGKRLLVFIIPLAVVLIGQPKCQDIPGGERTNRKSPCEEQRQQRAGERGLRALK